MKRDITKHKPEWNYKFLEYALSTAFVVSPTEKISYENNASVFFAKSIWRESDDHLERVSSAELQF